MLISRVLVDKEDLSALFFQRVQKKREESIYLNMFILSIAKLYQRVEIVSYLIPKK